MISIGVTLLSLIMIVTINSAYFETNCLDCILKYPSYSSDGVTIPYKGTQISGSGNIILAYTLTIYILVAIYSTVFALRRLSRPGVSKEVRSLFLKKHVSYVIVFISVWTIQLSQNYFTIFNPPSNPEFARKN